MRITSAGNVGIGTTNAAYKLVVSSGGASGIELGPAYSGTANLIQHYNRSGAAYVDAVNIAATHRFNYGSTEVMRVTSAGRLGIGNSAPGTKLDIIDTSQTLGFAQTTDVNASPANQDAGEFVRFASDVGASGLTFAAGDARLLTGTVNTDNAVVWRANNVGLFATDSVRFYTGGGPERARIDSSGNLLVGKTASAIATEGVTLGPNGQHYFTSDNETALKLNRLTTDGDIIQLRKDGTVVGSIGSFASDLAVGKAGAGLRFEDGTVSIRPHNMTTNAGNDDAVSLGWSDTRFKNLYLSGGVYLGGTAAANKLDDYEEGTFTPTIGGGTTNPTVSYDASRYGSYVKVGKMVFVNVRMRTDAVSGGSGLMQIGGLPFTNVSGKYAAVTIAYSKDWLGESPAGGYVNPNSTFFYLTYRTSASGDLENYVEISDLATGGNSNDLIVSVAYESA